MISNFCSLDNLLYLGSALFRGLGDRNSSSLFIPESYSGFQILDHCFSREIIMISHSVWIFILLSFITHSTKGVLTTVGTAIVPMNSYQKIRMEVIPTLQKCVP